MDILVVSHLYPTPSDSVTGVFVHEQTKALRARGHNVRVLSPTPFVPKVPGLSGRWKRYRDTPSSATIDGVEIDYPLYLSLPSRHTLPLVAKSARWSTDRHISKLVDSNAFSPDLISAHVPVPGGYACLPACRRFAVPLATTVHGVSIQKAAQNPLSRRQIKNVLENSDDVIFNSGVLQQRAEQLFPDLGPSHIVHNGVPLDEIQSASATNLPANFIENRLVVTSLGSLSEQKGQRTVFDALQQLPERVRPNYLLVGDGPDRDRLERTASGLESPVHFAGFVPHEKVFSYLKASDVMVLPSTDEAFGIAYIEAMACGCAVIGCEGEGPSEFVEDGKTGYLVPSNDVEAIAELLRTLSEDRDTADRIGDAARDYVRENLTWAENARQTEGIFHSAVERSRTERHD